MLGLGLRHCDLRRWRWQSDLSDRLCCLTHCLTYSPFFGSIAFSVDMQPTSLALANPVSHTLNYTVYTFPLESQSEVKEISHYCNFFHGYIQYENSTYTCIIEQGWIYVDSYHIPAVELGAELGFCRPPSISCCCFLFNYATTTFHLGLFSFF